MVLSNFHTHCGLDDGSGAMEEYVLRALSLGFNTLGFSCHTPCDLDDNWHLKRSDLDYYLSEIHRLKNVYGERIEIHSGLELDYLEDTKELAGSEFSGQVDYTIASVHLIRHKNTGRYLSFDGPIEEFNSLLTDNFHGDAQAFVTRFFQIEEELMERHRFDLLGHCDLIKKRNTGNQYFNPQEPWYQHLASRMLKTAKKHKVRIEVNTGGIARGAINETYPSMEMIRECADLGIALTLSSDAHQSTHLDFYFAQATDLLIQAGYRTLDTLRHGLWQAAPIK
jgi:histidinol-phosphatase (PHP family)